MRFYSLRFGCLLALACFVSVTWIKSIPRDGVSPGSAVQPELQTLYERLLVAEELGGQVSRDLSSILEQLKNISKAGNITRPSSNTTATTISTEAVRQPGGSGLQTFLQPNIYLYMPHLRQHPDSLRPNVVIGQGRRGVSMVMGIPTVKRDKQNYLVSTLSSLLYSLTSAQRQDLLIIVFVAEVTHTHKHTMNAEENVRKSCFKDDEDM